MPRSPFPAGVLALLVLAVTGTGATVRAGKGCPVTTGTGLPAVPAVAVRVHWIARGL